MCKNLCFIIIVLVAHGALAQIPTGEEIVKHLDSRVYSENMSFQLRMEVYKGDVVKSNYRMYGHKTGEKYRLEFEEPAIEKGRRLLNDGKSLWMFLPRSSKIIRLSNKQSFMGSDASNSDVLRVSLQNDYNVDTVLIDNDLLIIKLSGKNMEQAYYRINIYLNKNEMVPLKQEFLSLSRKVIRTIQYDNFKKVDGYLFPMTAIIKDELKKDSKTVLTYYSLSRNCDKSDFYFSTTSLRK